MTRLPTIQWDALKKGVTLPQVGSSGRRRAWMVPVAVLILIAGVLAASQLTGVNSGPEWRAASTRSAGSEQSESPSEAVRQAVERESTRPARDYSAPVPTSLPAPTPSVELAGRWTLETPSGPIPLSFYPSGGGLRVRLAGRHGAIGEIDGAVVMSGSTGRIRGLTYLMKREGPLSPPIAELYRSDSRTLCLRTNVVVRNRHGRYYVTGHVMDFTVRRAS